MDKEKEKIEVRGIKELRTQRGLSQMDVAVKCGLSLSTVYRLDKSLSQASAPVLLKLAKAFDVSLDELVDLPSYKAKLKSKDK